MLESIVYKRTVEKRLNQMAFGMHAFDAMHKRIAFPHFPLETMTLLGQRLWGTVGSVRQHQCDQIEQFIALWATFQSRWQQLFCPNRPHCLAIFVKVSKLFSFIVKSFLGNFYRHLATIYWSHCPGPPTNKNCIKNLLYGSGSGSSGRAVASDPRGPWQIFIY